MIRKRFHYLLILFLMLVFPLFIWGTGVLLDVKTVDVTGNVTDPSAQDGTVVYTLRLTRPENQKKYDLMFETKGNIIEVSAGGRLLYSYGRDLADARQMIGRTFVHAFLPEDAYEEPVAVTLTPVDSNAVSRIEKFELCSHEDSTRYYLTNKTLGIPLAMVLVSMAFSIPVFLLLGNARRLLYEGLLFGCVLLCTAVLLLSSGGHFLVMFADQRKWIKAAYLAQYLLPVFVLLYLCALQKSPGLRNILLGTALANLVFFGAAAALGLTETVHFCDLSLAGQIILVLDAFVGFCCVLVNVRRRLFPRVGMLLLVIAAVWAIVIAVGNLVAVHILPEQGLPEFEVLEIFAVFLFYSLCYLFGKVALRVRNDAEDTILRMEFLENLEEKYYSTAEIAKAMSEAYESIYVIEVKSGAYTCYYETSAHGSMGVGSSGDDFFDMLQRRVPQVIYPQDQAYVLQMLARDTVLEATQSSSPYTFIYRVLAGDREPVYHQARIVRRMAGKKDCILLGVRNIDDAMRREKEHEAQRLSMLQKEKNHLEAILSSAAGYLEANVTKDVVLERSYMPNHELEVPSSLFMGDELSYSRYLQWWSRQRVVGNREGFLRISAPGYLSDVFARGEKRASVAFTVQMPDGTKQPCRQVAYLYQDSAQGDVMCFQVIYDLTEQQKQEKEMKELENELFLSRIRVFTGQMQPHFLYNALGSIQETILEDPQYASELVGDFTVHLRSSIRAMSSDAPISFAQELENIRAYVNIEKMRFGSKLKVDFETEAVDFDIPPLSIQPLVENAIRHGIYQRGPEGGRVVIRSAEEEDAWRIQVEDDGVGFDVEGTLAAERNGAIPSVGLKNALLRLDKLMHAKVNIQSAIGAGTCVTVLVPKGEKRK